ncbi:hypothetical protein TWF718_001326 [Orbilia javanica]|uniref:ubiquitinyl hydrolase 1 n=1 Tax=Orbilia javanica TaxID=47235 RepID=A0AAN8NDP7_9PEZI
MSLKVLLSQPILFVPESTTQTTHAPGRVSVPVSSISIPESVSTLVSAIPVSRSAAIALPDPQGGAAASAVKPSGAPSPSRPLTSALLSSSSGAGGWYGSPSAVPKKRGYEAIEPSRPHDGSPVVKRRKVSADAEVAIKIVSDPMVQARGFRNRSGLHCYRNASLQALGHIPAFREKIRKHICTRSGCPACALRGAFYDHFARNGAKLPSHEPRGLQALSRSVGNGFAYGNRQEDAQEYIALLLDRLGEKSDPDCALESAISKIFGASKVSEVECVSCGKVNATPINGDLIAMLNLPQGKKGKRTSLEKCLESYTKEELIEDYRCESCGCYGIKKRTKFVTPPKVALICLSRFSYDRAKDNRPVSFSERLSWRDYTTGRPGASELVGVICHLSKWGSSGHYVTYLKTGDSNWLRYDDGVVSRCQGPPTDQEKEAYLLLYSRL